MFFDLWKFRRDCKPLPPPPHCARMSKPFYITTAIDYVNGQPQGDVTMDSDSGSGQLVNREHFFSALPLELERNVPEFDDAAFRS